MLKLRLISAILLLCPLWIFCQTNTWLEIDRDCQETNYFVQYISDNNHMLIGIPSVNESYITTDQGQSFQRFPWTYARFIIEIQTEESTDDFYFTDGQLIYKYDKTSHSADLVHDNSAYGYVKKGVLLKNGERLIIYTESGKTMIGRFDNDGVLVVSKVIAEERLNVELLYQEGYPAYITKSTFGRVEKTMFSFDPNDLSLGNVFVIEAHSTGMRYLNGRLFSSNEYSDDGGLTWTEISAPVDVRWGTSIDIYENQVIILARGHILHSTDFGATFTLKNHNLNNSSAMTIAFDNDGQRLVLYNSSMLDNILVSDDIGTTWTTYDNTLELSNTTRLSSLENDQLISNTINCDGRYRANDEWNDMSIPDNYQLWDFAGLPNGNYVGIIGEEKYLSKDNGANWELIVAERGEAGLSIKEGVVYVTGSSGVSVSEDNGESYTLYDRQDIPALWGSKHFSDISTIYYDENNELSTYDFVSMDKVSLQKTRDPLTHIAIQTDWSGKGFYILEYETAAQDQLVILRSESPGSGFDRKSIPITPVGAVHKMETDHNGNVLLYNEDQIMISQDQGDSWYDITPDDRELWLISDMTVSYDNYLYVSTIGTGVLKYPCRVDVDITNCTPFLAGNNNEEDVSLQISPNPFFEHVNLEIEDTENFEVKIYDINGSLLQTDRNMNRIELQSFSSGIYLLEFTDLDSSRKAFKKIVK